MDKTATVKLQSSTAEKLKDLSKRVTLPQYEIIDILLNDESINDVLKKGFEKKLNRLKNE